MYHQISSRKKHVEHLGGALWRSWKLQLFSFYRLERLRGNFAFSCNLTFWSEVQSHDGFLGEKDLIILSHEVVQDAVRWLWPQHQHLHKNVYLVRPQPDQAQTEGDYFCAILEFVDRWHQPAPEVVPVLQECHTFESPDILKNAAYSPRVLTYHRVSTGFVSQGVTAKRKPRSSKCVVK